MPSKDWMILLGMRHWYGANHHYFGRRNAFYARWADLQNIIQRNPVHQIRKKFLFGAFLVRVLHNNEFDFFYFREDSYVVYAILYLAGVVVCCTHK